MTYKESVESWEKQTIASNLEAIKYQESNERVLRLANMALKKGVPYPLIYDGLFTCKTGDNS